MAAHYGRRADGDAHAALHQWLREFEARAVYGLDERWAWRRRGRLSLGGRLTLVFLLLAGAGSMLVHYTLQRSAAWPWLALGGLLLAVLAYASVRHMLRPMRALGWGVAAFGRGDLKHRIRVRHRDEIGALAARFNRMADDIQAMLDGKRALLLAISHELRSPITRARLNAELLEEGTTREALVRDLALMRDLVEGLLERERLDSGHSALLLQDTDWTELVQDLIDRRYGAPLAEGALLLELEPALPTARLDRMRIQLLIGNLLDNALRYNERERGAVRLSLKRDGKSLLLAVRDYGPGVAEDALAQLGLPFFRPDESRTRASGGVGLGLNLCRLIAAAHGAQLEIRNADPGLEVAVRFGGAPT
ncbi:MAG TPA: ATP-binding protein [Methylibium sp.]